MHLEYFNLFKYGMAGELAFLNLPTKLGRENDDRKRPVAGKGGAL